MNIDAMSNASTDEVAQGTMAILDRAQDLKQHVQVLAVAAAFLAMTSKWDVEPQDAFTYIKNLMKSTEGDGWRGEFRALEAYVEGEL